MPFKKVNKGKCKGKYVSPSGKCFTKKQVALYYATDGTLKKKKKSCECKDKLIPDDEFKKDSTAFAAGKYDHGKYPVNLNLPKNKQPAQTQEFFDRYTRKK